MQDNGIGIAAADMAKLFKPFQRLHLRREYEGFRLRGQGGIVGRTGKARLSVEEYNGRKRNKVAAWLTGDAKSASQPQPARRSDNEPF